MEKQILLNIKGVYRPNTGEDSTLELSTEGKLFKDNDVYYIQYEGSEVSGMDGSTTLFSIHDKSVLMERFGKYQAQFFFEKGAKYIGSYLTEQGIIQMGIYSTKVDHFIGETEGSMDITYQMNIGNRYASMNDLSLRYKYN